MIKSLFVSPRGLTAIESSCANHLIITAEGLNQHVWKKLHKTHFDLSITIKAFGKDGCPANPNSQKKLF